MKNANGRYESAAQMGHVAYNVMYDSPFGLVHRKAVKGGLQKTLEKQHHGAVLMEEAYPSEEGMCAVYAILPNQLRAVTKGPSTTPRKPKNRPKKGTKPWTKIPYRFEDVEVGDIVVYGNSKSPCKTKIQEKSHKGWFGRTQNSMCDSAPPSWAPSGAHILKPYKEPVKPQDEEVYRIGDRFEITHINYPLSNAIVMLCQVSSDKAMLITDKGNRWTERTCLSKELGLCSKKDVEELIDTIDCTYKKI